MVKFFKGLIKHPFFLLPNAPSFVIKNLQRYVLNQGVTLAGNDFIDGPEVILQPLRPSEVYSLTPVLGTKYRYTQGAIRITSPEYNVFIKNGAVLGPEGWVLDKNGGFFEELTHSDRKGHNSGNSLYVRKRFPKREHLPGCYVTLCYPYSSNWYHWLIQSLPRLNLVKEYLGSVDGVFVPACAYHTRMLESLEYFGIPPEKVCILGNRNITVDMLIVPIFFAQSNVPSWLPGFFRSKALAARQRGHSSNLLYVSRVDTKNRQCLNELDVINSLVKQGFVVLQLSKIDFSEQASLFSSASVVVGSHGAGLANLVFCKEGASVVEIFPSKETHSDLFHSLATAARVDYWRLEGESKVSGSIHSDYTVDVKRLGDVVKNIIRMKE